MPFNPMVVKPERVQLLWPDTDHEMDRHGPFITRFLLTDNRKLVLVDNRNGMLKVAPVEKLSEMLGVPLPDAPPLRLCQLPDGAVAITTLAPLILFADVSGLLPFVASWVPTAKQYTGIASGGNDDTLIVSCGRSGQDAASIDVIRRDGTLVRTILDSNALPDLNQPDHIHLTRQQNLLVSDAGTNRIFVIEPLEGQLLDTYAHDDLKQPRQVITDAAGNCYVASEGGKCVLVRSVNGFWRRLLYGPLHGDGPRTKPWAVSLVGDTLVVAWDDRETYAVVVVYKVSG